MPQPRSVPSLPHIARSFGHGVALWVVTVVGAGIVGLLSGVTANIAEATPTSEMGVVLSAPYVAVSGTSASAASIASNPYLAVPGEPVPGLLWTTVLLGSLVSLVGLGVLLGTARRRDTVRSSLLGAATVGLGYGLTTATVVWGLRLIEGAPLPAENVLGPLVVPIVLVVLAAGLPLVGPRLDAALYGWGLVLSALAVLALYIFAHETRTDTVLDGIAWFAETTTPVQTVLEVLMSPAGMVMLLPAMVFGALYVTLERSAADTLDAAGKGGQIVVATAAPTLPLLTMLWTGGTIFFALNGVGSDLHEIGEVTLVALHVFVLPAALVWPAIGGAIGGGIVGLLGWGSRTPSQQSWSPFGDSESHAAGSSFDDAGGGRPRSPIDDPDSPTGRSSIDDADADDESSGVLKLL